MQELQQYLDIIVEPTFRDFERNPKSIRHAYLACVAAYHAIDRASCPKKPGKLTKGMGENTGICHRRYGRTPFQARDKRPREGTCEDEKAPVKNGAIPLSSLVFGNQTLGNFTLDMDRLSRGGIDLHNLYFVIHDCISFIRKQGNVTP